MTESTETPITPAYATFTTFDNFINGLREAGLPSRIDRSVMPTLSGSAQASVVTTLRFLKLTDAQGKPTKKMSQLVESTTEEYNTHLSRIIQDAYDFLFDGTINLRVATGDEVAEKFRAQGVSGSTVTKSVAFFLAAAERAGITVSRHVKPPKPPRASESKRNKRKVERVKLLVEADDDDDTDSVLPGMLRIPVPLPGMPQGSIVLPNAMTDHQWSVAKRMVNFILETYTEKPSEDH